MTKYTSNIQPNGILAFEGPDSIKFLQGQTTCHLDELTEENALYGAFCNPKGRIKTTFLLLKCSDDLLLMMLDKSQCTYLQEELKMYIAFFKSEIRDVTEAYSIHGEFSENADGTKEDTAFRVEQAEEKICISLPGTSQRRIILSKELNSDVELTEDVQNLWAEMDMINGIIWTNESARERFLPHDINLPGMGGVSYDKGCYTGQEIVARMHYRGNPKYTSAVFSTQEQTNNLSSPLKVVNEAGKEKNIGQLISEPVTVSGKTTFLASVTKDLLEQDEIGLSIAAEKTILCTINKPFLG